jgi:radical SAM superfamily enzyme YgiQ (UPF0313 family)
VGRGRWFNGRTFRFSLLSLLTVAAETPVGVHIRIVDEQVEEVPWDESFDLVGITCMTALAPRAYEIAARFRQQGVPVVLGGMHPTLCAEEAIRHADAIVVGEAEGTWPQVVADAAAGRLGGIYRSPTPPDLGALKPPPRHLLDAGRYATVQAVQASRGCPHGCDFCAVSAFHQRTQRRRPVADVVSEIRALPGRLFIFVDDSLVADRAYALELFAALRPLRRRWVSQCTLRIARDPALLEAAAAAGCIGVFVGLETFSEDNLESVGKDCHRVEEYREGIRRLHAQGIGVEAGIVLGLPGDTPTTFRRTLARLEQLEVDVIQVSVFTPLPGTPRHAAMQERILDRNWAHYDFHHVVFEPWRLSAESLQAGHDWLTREFYRPWRIARRVWRHLWRPHRWGALPFVLAVNLAYLGRVLRWHIRGWDPAAENQRRRPHPTLWARWRAWLRPVGLSSTNV